MSTPIENLRQVHRLCVVPCFDHSLVGDRAHCLTCAVTWPCDTVAALDALEYDMDAIAELWRN